MPIHAKYVHTNLIARDWKKLVRFYKEVFGCEPKGPERDLSAAWLDRVSSERPPSWRSSQVTWIQR
jgi:predicted enzyme related to lactoylglutathione lyase